MKALLYTAILFLFSCTTLKQGSSPNKMQHYKSKLDRLNREEGKSVRKPIRKSMQGKPIYKKIFKYKQTDEFGNIELDSELLVLMGYEEISIDQVIKDVE